VNITLEYVTILSSKLHMTPKWHVMFRFCRHMPITESAQENSIVYIKRIGKTHTVYTEKCSTFNIQISQQQPIIIERQRAPYLHHLPTLTPILAVRKLPNTRRDNPSSGYRSTYTPQRHLGVYIINLPFTSPDDRMSSPSTVALRITSNPNCLNQ
jgi:hypothetical protein